MGHQCACNWWVSLFHGVWKSQKKSHSTLRAKRLASYVYILSGQTFIKKCQKWFILMSFWKPEACGQTVLPDRSVLIGQKFAENAKIETLKRDILGDFQHCVSRSHRLLKNVNCIVIFRFTHCLNNFTALALTKLDILSDLVSTLPLLLLCSHTNIFFFRMR